jgi:lysozyme family protein
VSDAFDQAVAFVLAQEGGVSNDPRDPGLLTKYGISARAHPDLDISTLTREDAVAIYRDRYWALCRGDDWPPALAVALFDGAVQHGATQAVRLMQDALGVVRDGMIGPQTLAAAHALPWGGILIRFLTYRLTLYTGLPHWGVFGKGWSTRLFALQRCIYEGGLP